MFKLKNLSSWQCETCECVDIDPIVDIKLQVILNCVGIAQMVNLSLHSKTVLNRLPDLLNHFSIQQIKDQVSLFFISRY